MFQQFYDERQRLAQAETVDKIQKIEKIEKIVEVIAVEPEQQEPWETHLLLLKWLFIITVVAFLIAAIAFAAVMVH